MKKPGLIFLFVFLVHLVMCPFVCATDEIPTPSNANPMATHDAGLGITAAVGPVLFNGDFGDAADGGFAVYLGFPIIVDIGRIIPFLRYEKHDIYRSSLKSYTAGVDVRRDIFNLNNDKINIYAVIGCGAAYNSKTGDTFGYGTNKSDSHYDFVWQGGFGMEFASQSPLAVFWQVQIVEDDNIDLEKGFPVQVLFGLGLYF